ncbi:MAG: dTMP kinase [Candidatus Margulisbacteria bacterium]|nr:dTMP kinase [Candidatus Margulisiibacteriota bacterium]
MFITFEGGEGSGKSTQAKLLKEYFEKQGKTVVLTHEPGGTDIGKHLRQELLERDYALEPLSEIFLFAADRVEHVEKTILPALNSGKIVISDRYIDSTIAYQLGGRGLPEDLVRYVNWISARGVLPDITFLLDIPIEDGLKRAIQETGGEGDRFEKEILAFHERVRNKYLEIAHNDPRRVRIIDCVGDVQSIAGKIINEIGRN